MLAVNKSSEPIAREAALLRKEIINALYQCGGGHYGGSLSVLDIILVLYRNFIRTSIHEPNHPQRDRFILSKGHAAIAYYAVLQKIGFIQSPLAAYGQVQSPFQGHPDMLAMPGIDFSTGSLGQGLSAGLGMAIALRNSPAKVWVVLGDGECQEGQVWEAAMMAHRYKVDNLCAIVDYNKYQEWGWNYGENIPANPVIDIKQKWSAFGWNVLETNGHDYEEMVNVFTEASNVKGKPSVVIAHTIKGKGYPLIEADPLRFHCSSVEPAEQQKLENLPC